MPRMKTNTLLSSVIAIVGVAASALAIEGGNSARQGALFNGESGDRVEALYAGGPHIFSVGAYGQYQERSVQDDNDLTQKLSIRHLMTYLGCDVLPWLTLQAGIGQSDLSGLGDDRDEDIEWMGGAQLRLMDYMLIEPPIGEDTYWFGLDSNLRYTGSESDGFQGDVKWGEFFGSVTLSLTTRPERYGFVDRISIFFGPAVSFIRGTVDDEDISEDQSIGFVGGLQIVPSDNLTFRVEAEQFDDTSFGGSVAFHF